MHGEAEVDHGVILGFAPGACGIGLGSPRLAARADSTMDMTASVALGPRVPLFLATWVVMMVAMMLPTAAPMILTFHRVQADNRKLGDAFVTRSATASSAAPSPTESGTDSGTAAAVMTIARLVIVAGEPL